MKNIKSDIHKKSIVVDALSSIYLQDFNEKFIINLKKGGITAIHITVPGIECFNLPKVIEELAGWFKHLRIMEPYKVKLVTTVREIKKAKDEEGIAVILGSQAAGFLGLDLSYLELFSRIGMKTMQPTYQQSNQFGNGCGEDIDSGLSNLGIKWVEEMNKVGMVISLSHAGYKTSMDVMEISKDPVIFDHSNPKAICDVPRNINDEQIQTCANKNGVIGLCPLASFVQADKSPNELGVEDFINHIDYIVELVGVNHVGIGTDLAEGHFKTREELLERAHAPIFTKITSKGTRKFLDEFFESGRDKLYSYEMSMPWLKSVSELPVITEALLHRGYSDQDIEKILGSNILRVFENVWGE